MFLPFCIALLFEFSNITVLTFVMKILLLKNQVTILFYLQNMNISPKLTIFAILHMEATVRIFCPYINFRGKNCIFSELSGKGLWLILHCR